MLLGQNVNSYRGIRREKGGGEVRFAELLERVNAVNGIERIRFMTSHPKDLGDELIRTMAELPGVCEHLHLPLQSGSDAVLARMNRKYTYGYYRELVQRVRAAMPGIALTTDLIAGFPGETDEDHQRTMHALEEIAFDGAFIFKYSDREGTGAARFTPKVVNEMIVKRHSELLALQQNITMNKNRTLIGSRLEVLVEGMSRKNPQRLFGRTRTNKRVVFEGNKPLIGGLVFAIIRKVTELTLIGEEVSEVLPR
jgi:tRNA-2-methylthio-N6-dimethylallyladenosine synthase